MDSQLSEEVGRLVTSLASSATGVRWANRQQLHFTLKFLGEQDDSVVSKVAACLREIAQAFSSFSLGLSKGGAFPSQGAPRILWLGVQEGKTELINLATRIEEDLIGLGFSPEKRAFRPHLTIGRVKGENVRFDMERLLQGVKGEMTVTGFSLVESILKPQGAVYRRIEEFPLRNGRPARI